MNYIYLPLAIAHALAGAALMVAGEDSTLALAQFCGAVCIAALSAIDRH